MLYKIFERTINLLESKIYLKYLIVLTLTTCLVSAAIFCSKQVITKTVSNKTASPTDSLILTENQKKILTGAKKCLKEKFNYDNSMEYYVLTYKNGENTGNKVYPMGDLDPAIGVCTDVTIRAFRYGEVADLQEEIHNDLISNWSDYPMKRWNAKKPDTNIDHRRVPNQFIWFSKHWKKPDNSGFMPGDVVVWDMNNDNWGDHIGIVSDKFENGNFCLIHNFPSPGFVAEEDVLNQWTILGHFRIKE